MNLSQLKSALSAMGVVPKDIYRASLYLNRLQAAQTFFTQDMTAAAPNGLGNDYAFVQKAVQSSNLLQELADLLDFYLVPAVSTELQRQLGLNAALTYQGYFTNNILNVSDVAWLANVVNFFNRIPIVSSAMQTITNNFQQNVLLACQRVIADQVLIANFFGYQQYDELALVSLQEIKSTGSDFHKGGKQVLILTFDTTYEDEQQDVISLTLKVVYKPGDMEADCLIAGNTAVVNNAIPNFNTAGSLVEIFNGLVDQQMQRDPQLRMVHLPTYRILPRGYISAYAGAGALPVDGAYGYIEYLNHDIRDTAIRFCGYYPFASSDYIIFDKTDAGRSRIIETFYRTLGEWMALACTFSITDMHVENIRVNKYLPILIDLELSLSASVTDVTDTAMLGGFGGINIESMDGVAFEWGPMNPDPRQPPPVLNPAIAPVVFEKNYEEETYDNRLYANFPQKNLVKVNNFWLVRGFNTAMQTLQSGAVANTFNAWLTRTNNVLLRYLPAPTSDFKALRDKIYIGTLQSANNYTDGLLPTIQSQMILALTQRFKIYTAGDDPNFVAFSLPITATQYQNFDIPIFYTRVGSLNIYDSTGAPVNIPAQITTEDANGNPQVVNTNIGRATFFQSVPTTTNVVQNQLNVLAQGAQYDTRYGLLRTSLYKFLNLNGSPRVVDKFF